MENASCVINCVERENYIEPINYAIENHVTKESIYMEDNETFPDTFEGLINYLKYRAENELGCYITKYSMIEMDPTSERIRIIKQWDDKIPVIH